MGFLVALEASVVTDFDEAIIPTHLFLGEDIGTGAKHGITGDGRRKTRVEDGELVYGRDKDAAIAAFGKDECGGCAGRNRDR